MDDVVNLGSGRRPSRWMRGLAATVVALAIGIMIVGHLPHSHHLGATHQRSGVAATAAVQLAGLGRGAALLLEDNIAIHLAAHPVRRKAPSRGGLWRLRIAARALARI
jgi:hypothetical protein